MKNIYKIVIVFCFIISSVFMSACNNNDDEFTIIGDWSGVNSVDTSITVACEEYETLQGEFLGKRNGGYQSFCVVNNEIKQLTYKTKGLVERDTRLYLGEDFTFTYVLKDKQTLEVLYNSENVEFYEFNACFEKETKMFVGAYSSRYEKSYYEEIYVIDGVEYSSNDVFNYHNSYLDLKTNKYIGQSYDFVQEKTYNINGKFYEHYMVYELGTTGGSYREDWFSGTSAGGYLEESTNLCYKTDEIVRKSGYKYGNDNKLVADEEVKNIVRTCDGVETMSVDLNIGESYLEIELTKTIEYDYSQIDNYTYRNANSVQKLRYRGKFGVLDNVIHFLAEESSNDGSNWYTVNNSNIKFELKIENNKLLISGDYNALANNTLTLVKSNNM